MLPGLRTGNDNSRWRRSRTASGGRQGVLLNALVETVVDGTVGRRLSPRRSGRGGRYIFGSRPSFRLGFPNIFETRIYNARVDILFVGSARMCREQREVEPKHLSLSSARLWDGFDGKERI